MTCPDSKSVILKSVRYLKKRLGKRYVWKRGKRYLIMAKLDPVDIKYIIRQKDLGRSTKDVALEMKVCGRWVQKLYSRYLETGEIPVLKKPGRPKRVITEDMRKTVSECFKTYRIGAVGLENVLNTRGTHIPHNTIHMIMIDGGMATKRLKKARKHKYLRYERTHSNSMWHTDYKLLDDGRWFIAYMDDASRFITGYGVFEEATGMHAIEVLHEAMARHGTPASILTDRGSQFYANESEHRKRGASKFEQELAKLGIRHILARVNHPQTNGKLERFHGEIQLKQKWFKDIHELVHWWNHVRPHMSLDWDALETPSAAFIRKMPPKGSTVVDEQSGEVYDVI